MVRRTPPGRVRDVAAAACSVFTEKGYRRALMTDVGTRLGLSHAVLYRYVESKEALFELAMVYSMDPGAVSELEIPLPTPPPGHTLDLLRRWGQVTAKFPVLAAALARDVPGDPLREFIEVIDERYAFVSRNRRLLALIERSALDLPDLHELFFRKIRRQDIEQLSGYLARRMGTGALRRSSNIELAARFIMESIAWFAWHREADADSAMIRDDQAHQAVRELLAATFVPAAAHEGHAGASPAYRRTVPGRHSENGEAGGQEGTSPLTPAVAQLTSPEGEHAAWKNTSTGLR
jgi:AcrR family transcriptional regulator